MSSWSPSHSSSSQVDATFDVEIQAAADHVCSWYVPPHGGDKTLWVKVAGQTD